MKAVVLHQFGGVETLQYEDAEIPVCGKNEVMVKVRATSVNPIDWKIRSGSAQARMPIEFPYILGRDVSGEVVESHSSITEFPAGTRVIGLAKHTYAEFDAVNSDFLTVIPKNLSFEQAAALPLILTTGAQLIERAVKPEAGQTVLVTGALGSVGRTAVFVAKQHGARVLAGVRSAQRAEAAELGAFQVVALDDEAEIFSLEKLDAIADTVGGETITRLLETLKPGGVVGSVTGPPEGADQYDIRVEAFMAEPDAKRLGELAKDVADGRLVIPIGKTLPLKHIQEAQTLGESGKSGGKIVLIP